MAEIATMIPRLYMPLLFTVGCVPLIVIGCDRIQSVRWVGTTDLTVEFVVMDAVTGEPVHGARIEVQSEGGVYAEDTKQDFVLVADPKNEARKICRDSMCFGSRSGLGFTDTFTVHLPWWHFRALADSYEPSGWTYLDVPEFGRRTVRDGVGKSKLIVQVPLRKEVR